MQDIVAERFYTDPAGSIVDEGAVDRNRASLAALDATLQPIIRMTDRSMAGDREAGNCALTWLAEQARGRSMLGRMSARQAEYDRKWRTCGIAMAYLKVRRHASSDVRAVIEPWLDALADAVAADEAKSKTKNNHLNWSGFCTAAVGTATGAARHIAFAGAAFDHGLAAILADGTLPHEMARKSRALHYHNWALAPLVFMAELAAVRGDDWYSRNGGALHRLATRTMEGLRDPAGFARLGSLSRQDVPTGGALGWLAFYRARFPDRVPKDSPTGPFYYTWYGGNMTVLAQHWVHSPPH